MAWMDVSEVIKSNNITPFSAQENWIFMQESKRNIIVSKKVHKRQVSGRDQTKNEADNSVNFLEELKLKVSKKHLRLISLNAVQAQEAPSFFIQQ